MTQPPPLHLVTTDPDRDVLNQLLDEQMVASHDLVRVAMALATEDHLHRPLADILAKDSLAKP